MDAIKVFGHKSPDTDTTCSAIIWAWYLNATGQGAKPYMLGEPNNETAYVLKRWNTPQPDLLPALTGKDSVVIVDTNNPQELPENISDVNIVAIIDHHKLSGLATKSPLTMHLRPVACTATVMYDLMGEKAKDMPENIAGIVLSCILSDTLEFRSPTTTPRDQEVAEKIAAQYEIDAHALAEEMFAAKSDVSKYSEAELLTLDAKKFEVAGKNLLVSSLETTSPAGVLARKAGFVAAIKDIAAKEGVDDVLFFIVDILKEEATVLLHNDFVKKMIHTSFGADVSGDTAVLPGVVSRKKQILPVLKV
ncbi:manganese-dependent inorganic pyrophosphatase [Candidatus Kaiserbacteria bacterium RIFCSPHIGHO2_02_FULL_55_25]|uniref:inorganic diphosphatase n=1 Tax=Candidatus Kaiserbacteria bacterium RIFCSPHIGHO2_02_FULL_55_25 TaxID=1798498 RepID=A0A1F6E6P5_9BACT|nr:MAG: manganese-dependent inorganic pyrophosphatase [Candidatus Kaiserbacteria bacterium RIFCSPHIGHO2_01_FULL_55_79]OGG69257.1 MAG: manganese-dependent inorganic pyrophosphatase [Candidatus Kaiserbacteria bacterium RIFCSPHIGHO2_02_FULL_55_25]OGG77023.1 MAG: manganese-dependent inorganic pyrophosphatase [Candidatus Kaiserbacteria bacterium RIFCSPHIGHO2_12_FULL_55_13]OGG83891.1 MAG: manganese-dependent inorganic pyrophosphatase [Candidatus Kaiserbacteria bacterium RIFCSPLOWO2_01_FULL_55_25]